MIDDGIDQLCELVTVCNPYHGSYDATNGFVSRHGVPIAFLPDIPAAIGHASSFPLGYHWVDFNMPEITTPQTMLDLGQEMWNKTLLFGHRKYYAVAGTARFETGGWPYKAPDGSVWRLRGDVSGNTATVYGELLTMESINGGMPYTVLATLSITRPTLPVGFTYDVDAHVNFNPKSGAEAAINAFAYSSDGSIELAGVVVEVTVSGGDLETPPTITMVQTYGHVSNDVYFTEYVNYDNDNISPQVMIQVPTYHVVNAPTGEVTITNPGDGINMSGYFVSSGENTTVAEEVKYPNLTPAMPNSLSMVPNQWPNNGRYEFRYLCFVGYDRSGNRVVVSYETKFTSTWGLTQTNHTEGESTRRCSTHNGGASWTVVDVVSPYQVLTDHSVTYQNVHTVTGKQGFLRNGVLVPSGKEYEIKQTYTGTRGFTGGSSVSMSRTIVKQQNCNPTASAGNNNIRYGDAAAPNDGYSSYSYSGVHIASNAVCFIAEHPHTSQRTLYEYCDTEYDYNYKAWIDWVTDMTVWPIPHPETGAMEKKRLFYF